MIHFFTYRLLGRSPLSQFSLRGTALGLLAALSAGLFFAPFRADAAPLAGLSQASAASPEKAEVIESLEEQFSLGFQSGDLCAWERELGFFLSQSKAPAQTERIDCALREEEEAVGEMKEAFQGADEELARELDLLVAGFPIEVMTGQIARYDREIAGLIVGIGKKESNWGKRTPKLGGQECYNFWGYRGEGSRGLTKDGYGCWHTPEEAVDTIGQRLERLRDLRRSTEPARMIVWKCGSSCAGHSDESVRKWIADVDLYYRQIAKN